MPPNVTVAVVFMPLIAGSLAMRLSHVVILSVLALRPVWAGPVKVFDDSSERPVLKSIYAGTHQVSDFVDGGAKAAVFVFTGQHCPVAQQYVPTLKQLHERFQPLGIQFVAVYANSRVDLLSMAKHAHDTDIPFPAMLDEHHRLADLLDVQRTPEVVVLDSELQKRYQGAIDNQFTKRGRIQAATKNYLADALAAICAGDPPAIEFVPASGCPIERQPRPLPRGEFTYYRDVAPILQARCQSCHREGGPGPFELATYEDAYYAATTIAEVVTERRMPPWHAFLNPKFGKLKGDPRLSDQQINTILAWVEADAPAGDPRDAPEPVSWPSASDWSIGKPDFVYRMPEPFRVPKTGVLEYQFFRVRLNYPRDRWFRAIEVKPGNPEVVHHITLHLVKSGNKKYSGFTGMVELYGFNAEQAQLIGDYVPGDTYRAKVYPAGQAVRIPRGMDLVYELHYTPNNREATTDQSMVAFRWADAAPKHEVYSKVFRKPIGRFRIPPGHHHYAMEDSYYFEKDVEIDAVRAHFHLRGKSYRLEIVHRDENSGEIVDRETVLSIPVWDLDWQRTYELETPLRLEAGTELLATGHFDNSRWNPNNPDPDQVVYWGQQTNDEMFSTRFVVRAARPQDAKD